MAWDGFGLDGWSQSALLRAWQTEYWLPQLRGCTVGSYGSVWVPGKLSVWCGSQAVLEPFYLNQGRHQTCPVPIPQGVWAGQEGPSPL